MTKNAMVTEILNCCKANQVFISGDLFFGLAFLPESELINICHELNIKVTKGI